ncbi:hypothetical protein N7532_011922 [Penicillium argentinense]|uniref:Uncharacterized protein n=1 Tax=Penicillium argentinense TaxID=1131581 RepID=A0A9W9EJC7_9EURO|nr:uncharacterized protein N7532_011922 [Penicillium argentinense]KAJ5082879.1 hypothetical protein N7532_011922 [Penicillium argentinense]
MKVTTTSTSAVTTNFAERGTAFASLQQKLSLQRVPPGLSPPVGSKHMMDLFNDPDRYVPGAIRVIQQIPKKMNASLVNSSSEQIEEWGICFQEGWNRSRIWWLLAGVFGVGSLLFGVVWGVLEKDVQGAFGVAGWWMMAATILVGVLGAF